MNDEIQEENIVGDLSTDQALSKQGSSIYSDNEIKKIYDSTTSARRRKVCLDQICKCLQLLNQSPTSVTIRTIYDEYRPEHVEEGNESAVLLDLDQFSEILKTNSFTRDERWQQLNAAFLYFDKNESGVINTEPLKTLLLTVGDCLADKECTEFFREAKPGTDGKWPYDDFVKRLVDAFPRPQSKRPSAKNSSAKRGGSKQSNRKKK